MNKTLHPISEWVVMGFLCLLYVCFVGFLIPVGSDDLRMTNVFSIDESDIVAHLWNIYVTDFNTPPSFKYGSVFYLIPVGLLHIWALVFDVSEQTVVIVARFYCSLAGLGCLWLTYLLGRLVFGGLVGVLAACMLGLNPTFLRWSTESHPDLPQLFFILMSLFFLCHYVRRPTLKTLVWASLGAGLAFATKYAGIFLIPVSFLSVYLSFSSVGWLSRFRLRTLWVHWGVVLGVFCGIIVLTTPSILTHFTVFVSSLKAEKEIMAFGHRVRDTTGAWLWLQMVVTQVGIVPACVSLFGCVVWLLWHRNVLKTEHLIILGWVGIFLCYLMVESSLKRARHLLPILPVIWIFVAASCVYLWSLVQERLHLKKPMHFVLVLLVVGMHWPQMDASANLFKQKRTRESDRVEIAAGRWLTETYPPNIRIIFDAYSYVPSVFEYVFRSVGTTYLDVTHFEPDVLVIRDAIVSDYSNLEEANSARIGEVGFKDCHYFYKYLQEGKLADYRLKKDFGSVAIYERTIPKVRDDKDLKTLWLRLLSDYVHQRRYGVAEAYWTMGLLHAKDGLMEMAAQEFARAQKSQNFTKRIYTHGTRLLKYGLIDEAKEAIDAALHSAREESEAFQAGIREDLAYRFFDAEQYDDMLIAAQEALNITDNLPAASFEVAAAHLAMGNVEQGKRAFDNAVLRFGAHEKGKVLLKLLGARGIASDVVAQLNQAYYGQ